MAYFGLRDDSQEPPRVFGTRLRFVARLAASLLAVVLASSALGSAGELTPRVLRTSLFWAGERVEAEITIERLDRVRAPAILVDYPDDPSKSGLAALLWHRGDVVRVALPGTPSPGATVRLTVKASAGVATVSERVPQFTPSSNASGSVGAESPSTQRPKFSLLSIAKTSGDSPPHVVMVLSRPIRSKQDDVAVTIGGVAAAKVRILSPTRLEAPVPPEVTGAVAVVAWDGPEATDPVMFDVPPPLFRWAIIAAGGVLVAVIAAAVLVALRRARLRRTTTWGNPAPEEPAPEDPAGGGPRGETAAIELPLPPDREPPPLPRYPEPSVPSSLVEALASHACVLFAGGGVASAAGAPTWPKLLLSVLETVQLGTDGRVASARAALAAGDAKLASDLVAESIPRPALQDAVGRILSPVDQRDPSPLHSLLAALPFRAAVTTSWDDLLARAFAPRHPTDAGPFGLNATRESVRSQAESFLLVRMFGTRERMLFTDREANDALRADPVYAKLLLSFAQQSSLLFVGTSLEGIESFLSSIYASRGERTHFALVALTAGDSVEAARVDLLHAKYGVQVVPYSASPDHPEVVRFFSRLRDTLASESGATPHRIATPKIQRVRLSNIGPFVDLDLSLNDGWTVFLGNNGCGKSTLLRAIALGLCGDDPEATKAGARLLSVGATRGFIDLSTGDGASYRTELSRDGSRVRVESRGLTPLQTGRWAILGFPPLRGASLTNPKGPSGERGSEPDVHDLLPLIDGTIDRRVDSLKQWLVNLDVRSIGQAGADEVEPARNRRLRDRFYELMSELTPGIPFRYGGVDHETWDIILTNDDGRIPLDALSQGVNSVFGWIGTTLQRMYEIHGPSDSSEREPAVLLVDEIDAHLHPEWQLEIVQLVKRSLPSVQIIATTHSPLVVAGMRAKEVFITRRDDTGRVSVSQAPFEFEGLRADQILTSPLFGLRRTRSGGVQQEIDRYADLLGKGPRQAPEEKAELEGLRARLDPILSVGETHVERKVEQAVRKAVGESLSDPLDERTALEVKRQLSDLFPKGGER